MNKRRVFYIVMASLCFTLTVFGILTDVHRWIIALDAFCAGFYFSEALNTALIQKYEKVLKEVDVALDKLIERIKEEKENEEASYL